MSLGFLNALASLVYWAMVLITIALVGLSVALHYEGLERINHSIPHWRFPTRVRIFILILAILLLHTLEIWIFGIGIDIVVQWPSLGHVGGAPHLHLLDAIYLSAMTYTTVGHPELIPKGPMRLIIGSEALTGFVLITWSASFTYLEMQRYWRTH